MNVHTSNSSGAAGNVRFSNMTRTPLRSVLEDLPDPAPEKKPPHDWGDMVGRLTPDSPIHQWQARLIYKAVQEVEENRERDQLQDLIDEYEDVARLLGHELSYNGNMFEITCSCGMSANGRGGPSVMSKHLVREVEAKVAELAQFEQDLRSTQVQPRRQAQQSQDDTDQGESGDLSH